MASAAKTTNEELLARLRSDSDSGEVMAQLWERNQGLIRLIVHNVTGLTGREEGFEDMLQQAYFGFHAAAQEERRARRPQKRGKGTGKRIRSRYQMGKGNVTNPLPFPQWCAPLGNVLPHAAVGFSLPGQERSRYQMQLG